MKQTQKKFVGDILVSFETAQGVVPSRFSSSPWEIRESRNFMQVWTSPVAVDWKGFPLQEFENEFWTVRLLGEVHVHESDWIHPDLISKIIEDLRGHFLILAYEKKLRRWHVWTDRFGTLHMYYSRKAFGTFSPSVASFSLRKLDWHALTGFFGFGFFPHERTHHEDVFIVLPASHYVFSEQGELIQRQRYWRWNYVPDLNRSYDDTVAEFASIFGRVMTEALAEPRTAVPLSGGLDSRSSVVPITSEIKHKYWSYAYGYTDDSAETRIARQIAEKKQLSFDAFTIQPYLFENLDRIFSWTEGFLDVTQPRQVFVRDEIANRSDVLIAALWGDVWLDEMGLTSYPFASLTNEDINSYALGKIKKDGRSWLLENLIRPQLAGEDPEEILSSFVKNAMQPFEHIVDPDFRVKAFKTDNWSFRWSLAPIRIFQSAAQTRLIFYDHRIADFFQTVPSSFLTGRQMQVDYLKRFAPELAQIPWQVYDANLYQYRRFNTWLLPKRILKKIVRTLWNKRSVERNWEVQFLSTQGQNGLRKWLMQPGLHLHEFVPRTRVTALLDEFYHTSNPSLGYTVSMLLTFSVWLEKYG